MIFRTEFEKEQFEERAAIKEFDGDMTREQAEIEAMQELMDKRQCQRIKKT